MWKLLIRHIYSIFILKPNYLYYSKFQIIRDAENLASRMKHRGACGFDNDTGDGAGVMVAIPHSFYQKQLWVGVVCGWYAW